MLPGTKSGAQRASRHRSLIVAVALAIITLAAANPLSAGAGTPPWLGSEKFALFLVNCMRTGGYVRSDGTCAGYGSGRYSSYVAPLRLSGKTSWLTSRPWAKSLAIRSLCYHGDPGARLRADGFTGWTWGENIGCRDGYATAREAVLMSSRYFQAEKSSNGGHWKNIRNRNFRCVGIGVWRYNGRTRLVQDFTAPCM
jgi:hypothetical protein